MKRTFKENTVSSGGILVIALMAANFLNFAFNAILGRVLTLEEFSILTLANTLWFLISIFLSSIGSTTNNRTAYLLAKRGPAVAHGFRSYITQKSLQISLLLCLLWLISLPLLAHLFHTNDYLIFFTIAPAICLGIYIAVSKGYLQGGFSFIKVAFLILIETISKLVIALVMVFVGLNEYTYLAIPISVLITFIATIILISKSKTSTIDYKYIFPRKLLFATFLTAFSSTAFLSLDLLLARHFLSESESGSYSLLSLVGKMVFFFGTILNVFILTLASRDMGLNKNTSKNFYKILGLNVLMLQLGFVTLGLFGNTIVPLLFGEKSQTIINYLVPYTFGIVLYTTSSAFSVYHLAKQQFVFAYNGILATVLMIIGLLLFHSSIYDFIGVIIIVCSLNLFINLLLHVFYKDISDYVDEEDRRKFSELDIEISQPVNVSICLPAYNEGRNIKKVLESLLVQETKFINIDQIVVVSSASTDDTDQIAAGYAKKHAHITLIKETERKGKASAINSFLKVSRNSIVVVQSADTLAKKDCIEKLCKPFLFDTSIGMTGGAPIPVNDPNSFLGFVVHTWWWFHRNIPRFGEIIAFRNVIGEVSPRTAVDEAYIQAKFAQLGYKIVHVDEAVVYNKGSENIKDIIKQRRRIFNGHTRLFKEENIKISHMSKSGIKLLIFEYKMYNFHQLMWLVGGILIELYANILGNYDKYVNKINPVVWDIASSTKDLSPSKKGAGK